MDTSLVKMDVESEKREGQNVVQCATAEIAEETLYTLYCNTSAAARDCPVAYSFRARDHSRSSSHLLTPHAATDHIRYNTAKELQEMV